MLRIIGLMISAVFILIGCSNSAEEINDITTTKQNQENKLVDGNNGRTDKTSTTQATQEKEVTINSSKKFPAELIKIIDGDTIKVIINGKEETVRFLLVDTPETHHPRLGVQPYGPEASAFTKQLLSESTVQLEKDVSERDKYGRLLMYVYTPDGRSVQEELLKSGLARVAYVYPPNTKYVDEYNTIQKTAQKNNVGIWSIENYAQEDGFHAESNQSNKQTETISFPADANGGCKGQIKGNKGSNGLIYHIPSGRFYNVTKAEECFSTQQAAIDAGYRKSSR